MLAAAFWLGGFGLPSAVASQLPVAVTSEFLVPDGIERLVFGDRPDRENFRPRPEAVRGLLVRSVGSEPSRVIRV